MPLPPTSPGRPAPPRQRPTAQRPTPSRVRFAPALPLLFAVSASLTACTHNTDLIAKLNAQPIGDLNNANIATMVANPQDLLQGRGGGPIHSAPAILSIQRIETDRARPLAGSGGGSGGTSGGGGGAGGAGGSGG